MLNLQSKLPAVGTTIFSVMSKLAQEYDAINLSQGFPDFEIDKKLKACVSKSMAEANHQYAPMPGDLLLRERIAGKTENLHQIKYDPDTEITVTSGATQAIFTAIASCVNIGDEVIIFEPAYDCYAPIVKLFGGLVKPHILYAPDYKIDWELLPRLFSARTKLIILNSPHNPTGTLLSKEDLNQLAKLVKGTDILILSDEVYEHLVYDDQQHESVMLNEELQQRSFIVASFGKLLHTTGWKLGYCLAPKYLMHEFRKIHQFNVFSVNSVMQRAIAYYLDDANHYLSLSNFFQQKRDFFSDKLASSRFKLLSCHGSYFQAASFENISDESDEDFCIRLVKEFGVAAIPISTFYQGSNDQKIIRFCFAKENKTLAAAAKILCTV